MREGRSRLFPHHANNIAFMAAASRRHADERPKDGKVLPPHSLGRRRSCDLRKTQQVHHAEPVIFMLRINCRQEGLPGGLLREVRKAISLKKADEYLRHDTASDRTETFPTGFNLCLCKDVVPEGCIVIHSPRSEFCERWFTEHRHLHCSRHSLAGREVRCKMSKVPQKLDALVRLRTKACPTVERFYFLN